MRQVHEYYLRLVDSERLFTMLPYPILIGGLICLSLLSVIPKIEKPLGFIFKKIRKQIK